MNNEECQEVFNQLADFLGQQRVGWIVEQVDEEISLGKVVQKQIKENRSKGDNLREVSYALIEPVNGISQSQKTSLVQQTEEYTSGERLRILISAIKKSITDAGDMERDITSFLAESGQAASVDFADETRNRTGYVITSDLSSDKRPAQERLISLLNSLEAEI